jgi:2-oxoglutarate ferredoxin oxidoreductase subunit alpha
MNRTVTIEVKQLDRVVIRFAGDSGDGMQLTTSSRRVMRPMC